MTPLTQRGNFLDRSESLSLVALAITYAGLTLALATEWGRIAPLLATELASGGEMPNTLDVSSFDPVLEP